LIAHGHRYGEALDYTLVEFRQHLAAIQRMRAREAAMQLHLQRMAQHGQVEDVRRMLQHLDAAAQGGKLQDVQTDDTELRASLEAFGIPDTWVQAADDAPSEAP
jgi:rRNA-processing protein FCF1